MDKRRAKITGVGDRKCARSNERKEPAEACEYFGLSGTDAHEVTPRSRPGLRAKK